MLLFVDVIVCIISKHINRNHLDFPGNGIYIYIYSKQRETEMERDKDRDRDGSE